MVSVAGDPEGGITPVILSGGAGTRLWPYSRRLRPKQFLPLVSTESMFGQTLERLTNEIFAPPLAVCNDEHRFLVAEEFRQSAVEPRAILLEPEPRNTAAAIAVAALFLVEDNPDGVMLVLPSDHLIERTDRFLDAVSAAAAAARSGYLVTFGVKPTRPETGYGYIRMGNSLDGYASCRHVSRFVEKPDHSTAETYFAADDFCWNSGMFMFSAASILAELERFHPEIVSSCRAAVNSEYKDLSFTRLGGDAFAEAPSISFDYAVMEKTDRAVVVEVDFDWNDVGVWAALHGIGDADDAGNVTLGDVVLRV